ncbi:transcriptional regulator [Ignicoccus pacificus DSM 13166]|uniref:Transcriptional regulator n=1 Tax=Ignicoccus pacificus DSM 13166 TaxID=940294 RepID=A0A977KA32_9CREN|nr:transcriptional regulator [Ignicoccus pacificus DSM 13166]
MPYRGISWAAEVLRRLKGVDFPVTKDVLKEKLQGLYWKGIPIEKLLDEIEVNEFHTPAEVLHYLAEAARKLEQKGEVTGKGRVGISWAAEVLRRLKGTDFPVKKEELKEKLKGLYWRGIPIEVLLDRIEKDEFETPAELLHYLAEAARKLEEKGFVAEASA